MKERDDDLDGLQHDLVVGGAEVRVCLGEQVYSQNDRVSGEIIIIPPEKGQDTRPILKLREFWTETVQDEEEGATSETRMRTQETLLLSEFSEKTVVQRAAFSVQLCKARSYPFQVQLPRNGRFSTDTSGWQLAIQLDLPGMGDAARGVVRLAVRPAEEFTAILEAWQLRLRFREEEARRSWDPDTVATTFHLNAPRALRELLEQTRLDLTQNDDGGVACTLFLDLEERGITDYFKALFDMDKVTRRCTLTQAQIFLPNGAPNHEELTRLFGGMLQEALGAGS